MLFEKSRTITEMESGTEPSNVVKKLVFLEILYQHGCYLEIKKKLKVLCNLVRLALKKHEGQTKCGIGDSVDSIWLVQKNVNKEITT